MGTPASEVQAQLARFGSSFNSFVQGGVYLSNKDTAFGKSIVQEGKDKGRQLSQGFCRGACLNWIRRALLGGHIGYCANGSKKTGDDHKDHTAFQFKRMTITHIEAFDQSLGHAASPNQWKEFAQTVDDRTRELVHGKKKLKRPFSEVELVYTYPDYRTDYIYANFEEDDPDYVDLIDAAFGKASKALKHQADMAVVVGIEIKEKDRDTPHAVAVHKAGGSAEGYSFFDPNYGTLSCDAKNLRKVFAYLFGGKEVAKPIYGEDGCKCTGGANLMVFAAHSSLKEEDAKPTS